MTIHYSTRLSKFFWEVSTQNNDLCINSNQLGFLPGPKISDAPTEFLDKSHYAIKDSSWQVS